MEIWLFGKYCGNDSGEMGQWPPEILNGGGAVEPRARECIEALSQMPEWSVPGSQLQTQAVRICVEVQVRVGPCAHGGALTREITQDIDRQVRPLPVAGQPCSLMCQEPQLCCRPGRHPWGGALDLLSPHQLSTKADAPDVAARGREHRWQRVSALETLGDEAVAGLDTRVLQRTLSMREGLEVRVVGLDAIAPHTGPRDGVCVLSAIARGQGIEVLNRRTKAALAASVDGRLPQQRAASAVVASALWAA
jgi:hypothetical protein